MLVQLLAAWYIGFSFLCSLVAFVIMILWVGFGGKDHHSITLMVLDRMLMIIILGMGLVIFGAVLGLIITSFLSIPYDASLEFAFTSAAIGMFLGVTLGWWYAFRPLQRMWR